MTVTPVNDVPVLAGVESGSAGVHGERRGDGGEPTITVSDLDSADGPEAGQRDGDDQLGHA